MLIPSYTKQFAKDLKKMLKRGKSDEKIKRVIRKLINEEQALTLTFLNNENFLLKNFAFV